MLIPFTITEAVVQDFDDERGCGWVGLGDGTRIWFHCTQIMDGTRTIDVGEPISMRIGFAPNGIEATEILKLKPDTRI